jgi:hypothetical protein
VQYQTAMIAPHILPEAEWQLALLSLSQLLLVLELP